MNCLWNYSLEHVLIYMAKEPPDYAAMGNHTALCGVEPLLDLNRAYTRRLVCACMC